MKKSTWVMLAVWVALLVVVFLIAVLPIMVGTDAYLETRPVDPRDFFRGDFVALQYTISTLNATGFSEGDTIFVSLDQEGTDPARASGVHKDHPGTLAIRGTVDSVYDGRVRVSYGIEEYYIPVGSGREMPGPPYVMHVRIGKTGTARIMDLLKDGEPVFS